MEVITQIAKLKAARGAGVEGQAVARSQQENSDEEQSRGESLKSKSEETTSMTASDEYSYGSSDLTESLNS
jgi:hypothetical protein